MENQVAQLAPVVEPVEETAAVLPWVIAVVVALLVAAAALVVFRSWKRRRRPLPPPAPALTLDIASLPVRALVVGGPGLTCYNLPARLAVVILAPAGRSTELPAVGELHELLEGLVPGLSEVTAAHQPLVRRWPPQLSVRGFAQQFFTHVPLPGDHGKGTPWCALAGAFKFQGRTVMVGLILRTETSTGLGQRAIERETQWLDVLRTVAPA